MSVETLAIVLNHSRAKGTAKVVLIGIANHAGDGGAWPSVATLARYANVARSNVQTALGTLEKLGEVRRLVSAGGDHNTADYLKPNLYEILVRCPENCDRSANHRQRDKPRPLFDPALPVGHAPKSLPALPAPPDPALLAGHKPSLEPDLEQERELVPVRARATAEFCSNGHRILGVSGGGIPFCEVGCPVREAVSA